MEIEVIDNFLPAKEADNIEKVLSSGKVEWYFGNDLNYQVYLGNYYFVHHIMLDYKLCSNYYDLVSSVLNKRMIVPSRVGRIKINMHPRTQRRVHMGAHQDYSFNSGKYTLLYYVNDSDAPTFFGKGWRRKKIECKKNRLVIFDGSFPHHSTSPTDINYRLSVNFDVDI